MNIDRIRSEKTHTYMTKGMYDFDIQPNAIISDQARFNAISVSAQKAIDAFIAAVAAEGSNPIKE